MPIPPLECHSDASSPAIERIWPPAQLPNARRLHGAGASRAIEQVAQAALPPHALMRRAGLAIARLARALAPHARQVRVIAGPGNNGGDGLEAAVHLQAAGMAVTVHHLRSGGDAVCPALPADAADALQRARLAGVRIGNGLPEMAALREVDLIVDALLGLGISRAPDGAMAQAIARVNACGRPVLAVDLPSGLNADTGHLPDPQMPGACVRARWTLSLLSHKPGLFTAHGRDHAGEIWFDDLGVKATPMPPTAWLNAPVAGSRTRAHAEHKGSYGCVAVLGGAPGMSGAAWLAARAALHAGAGRVYVQPLDANAAGDPAAPELMVRSALDWAAAGALDWVAVAGCGGGESIAAALPPLLTALPRLVLDADALNAISRDPVLRRQLAARARQGWQTVLTPHPLEAARLLDLDTAAVQADRLRAASQLADSLSCVVVLKGSGTVIAQPGAQPWINPTGNARLGTAGTGDVLAGWIGGLWAAAAPRDWTALDAARHAVWAHGLQADRWPEGVALTAGALALTPTPP